MQYSLNPIIGELEKLFSSFNQHFYNNELCQPVITINPDTTRGAYGWCTSRKVWKDSEDSGHYEINICAEYLNRPIEEICQTLLHEMVHLWNSQNSVKDTSRFGYYHNKSYKEAAEKHGLLVEQTSSYGWNKTSLNKKTREFIEQLHISDFTLYRDSNKKPKSSVKKPKKIIYKYFCPLCDATIESSGKVHIRCADCNVLFQMEDKKR